MAFLDRFRPQPRWKHTDAAVRLGGVEALSADDQTTLAAIAREDTDARVRCAAVARILDLPVLAEIARQDVDAAVRDLAVLRLVEGVIEAAGADEAQAALSVIADPKHLVAIARSAANETVRLASVARLTDPRHLGSVARHAADAATRLQALERLHDSAEVAAVALKSEHRDVALAALETIDDPDALKAIAGRARNKVAARRARAKLRAVEETPRPPSPEEVRARRLDVCGRVTGLMALPNAAWVAAELGAAELAWSDLGGDEDPELADRFAAARNRVRERLQRLDAERVENERLQAATRAASAEREALCDRAEALGGDAPAAALDEIRAAWAALPPIEAALAAALAERFGQACRAADTRRVQREARRERHERLTSLADEAARVVEVEELAAAQAAFGSLKRQWSQARQEGEIDPDLDARVRAAAARLSDRDAAAREAQRQQQQKLLASRVRTCERAEAAMQAPALSLKDAERHLRDVRAVLEAPRTPAGPREEDELARRLKVVSAALFARVQELRQMDEWQRWANVTIQEELCARTEALMEVSDIPRVARDLQDIREKWKAAAQVSKEQAGPLWARFKAAQDKLRARCDAYFAQQARERADNLAKKTALAERAEALATSTDWIKTAQELQRLQEEWKAFGPVPHHDAKVVWQRFRTACNTFFTRRHADLVTRKGEWAANLARKEALCAQAEAYAESVDWEAAAAAVRQLQSQWKTVGPVKRTKSDAIWQRFRAACDRFFERYKQRDQIDRAASRGEREALCVALEQMLPSTPAPAGEGAAAATAAMTSQEIHRAIRDVQARWHAAGPPIAIPRADYEQLSARFTAALVGLGQAYPEAVRGSELDPEFNRHRLEKLCERVEGFLPKGAHGDGDASPAAILAQQLREALAANTIGGRADEEAKWRSATDEVKRAQSEWRQVGPVPDAVQRALTGRFQQACTRFFDYRRRMTPAASAQPAHTRDR